MPSDSSRCAITAAAYAQCVFTGRHAATAAVALLMGTAALSACSARPWSAQAPDTGVVGLVATYRQRGAAASDHVFDRCHDAIIAARASGTNAYESEACSTSEIVLETGDAEVSVSTLAHRVASSHSSAVSKETLTATIDQLNALAAAFRAWQDCVKLVTTQEFFAGRHCEAESQRTDAARADVMTLAREWPAS
jgi:hypothetical protein